MCLTLSAGFSAQTGVCVGGGYLKVVWVMAGTPGLFFEEALLCNSPCHLPPLPVFHFMAQSHNASPHTHPLAWTGCASAETNLPYILPAFMIPPERPTPPLPVISMHSPDLKELK